MIRGFSLLELIVVLTLSVGILTIVLSSTSESTSYSQKVTTHQQRMEAIFHTVEMLRSDLTKCGMRLQEAAKFFTFPLFENSDFSFKVNYGIEKEVLIDDSHEGEDTLTINRNDFFNKGKRVVIYDPEREVYEINEVKSRNGDQLTLVNMLQNDYPKNAMVVVLKQVEYKLYSQQNTKALKRKVNKGYFQPLIENVTDFNVKFYPEAYSVLYRIEINKKEQVRGYIFLTNMVEK